MGMTLGKLAPVEMRVTAKRPSRFYFDSALSLLKGNDDSPPAKNLIISGLGGAISVASSVVTALEDEGAGKIENIETAYINPNHGQSEGRAEPQIKIWIRSLLIS